MEIKRAPAGTVIPLEEDELNAILLATQLIAALGKVKRNGLVIMADIGARTPVPIDEAQSGIAAGSEHAIGVTLRMVAAAQAAHNEILLDNASGTVN
jgi:hypothetical protein